MIKTIGIIGGGQLGKMMILEAKKLGFHVHILDPVPNCPAHGVADEHLVAGFQDASAISLLANQCDVITYELEHINVQALEELERNGKPVYPSSRSLKVIQHKLQQKKMLQQNGIPVPRFMGIDSFADMDSAGRQFGYPYVLKACTGGYDGRGNFVIHNQEQKESGFEALHGKRIPLMAEQFFPFTMEVSVLACRGQDGSVAIYPVGQNLHHDNILIETLVPANLSDASSKKALDIAEKVLHVFQDVGMFCIELFIGKDGEVMVNEIAPRPHNSGHYTIEACMTSQFAQHIRAVAGLPLGSTKLFCPAAMRNILGTGATGPAVLEGEQSCLSIPGVALHIYGKEESREKRKMGHITALGSHLTDAVTKVRTAGQQVRIHG